jgi:hypothetical protein
VQHCLQELGHSLCYDALQLAGSQQTALHILQGNVTCLALAAPPGRLYHGYTVWKAAGSSDTACVALSACCLLTINRTIPASKTHTAAEKSMCARCGMAMQPAMAAIQAATHQGLGVRRATKQLSCSATAPRMPCMLLVLMCAAVLSAYQLSQHTAVCDLTAFVNS